LGWENKIIWVVTVPDPLQSWSLVIHTLSPVVFSSLEALLEGLFWNGVQLLHHVLYDVLVNVKTEAVYWCLHSQEQVEITRSRDRRVGSLANLWNAVLSQETLDQV
jgi:hypothetical protein